MRSVLNKLAKSEHWSGCRYNLLENNCNHFCSDACWALLRRCRWRSELASRRRPPDWINKTAEKMARQHRTSHVKEQSLRLALASYKARFGGGRGAFRAGNGWRMLERRGETRQNRAWKHGTEPLQSVSRPEVSSHALAEVERRHQAQREPWMKATAVGQWLKTIKKSESNHENRSVS